MGSKASSDVSHSISKMYFGDLFDGLVLKRKVGMKEKHRETLKKTGIWFATHNRREEDEGEWVDKEWVLLNFGSNFVSSCMNHPGHWLHVPVGQCRVHNQGMGLKTMRNIISKPNPSRAFVRVNLAEHPILKQLDSNWPKCKYKQLYGLPSCIFHSFASALHFIGEQKNIGKVRYLASTMSSKANSMVKASTNTHDRLSMIIGLIKDEKFGYPQLHEGFTYYGDYVEFNIFNSYRHAPTIVIAVSIDEGTNHAVTLFDNYIFDSNEDHAIPISIEGLNRCFPPAFKRTQGSVSICIYNSLEIG